jgi:MFS transporter, ACS family, glucarate transporter
MAVPPSAIEKPTRARYGVIAFAVTLAVITYIDRIAISQSAPFISKELGLTTVQMGWVFSAFFWTYALFEIPGGLLGDRYGARQALTRVVIAWSIFTAATGWVSGLVSLLVVRALFGAGEAGCFPNVTRAFASWLPAKDRARAQGILWLAARWGGAFTPLIVAAMLQVVSWRRSFEIFGVLGVVWAVLFYRWFRDTPDEHPRVNAAERALLVGREPARAHGPTPWRLFLRSRTVWLLWAQYTVINYGWPFYITWLPTYLQEARGLDLKRSALFAGIPLFFGGIGCILSGMLSGPLARLTGSLPWARKSLAMVGCFGAAVCLVASPFIADPFWAVFVLGLASFSNDLLMPSAWATCMDVGGRHAGTLSGSMNMFANLMAGASPVLVSYVLLWTNRNWPVSFYIGAGFYLLGVVSWAFIDPTERLDRRAPERAVAAVAS